MSDSIYTHIGNEIRRLRQQRRVTQDALAKALGVSTNTVSRWETGVYHIDLDDIQDIATVFHVALATLLPGEQPTAQERLAVAVTGLDDDDMRQLIEYAAFLHRRRKDV